MTLSCLHTHTRFCDGEGEVEDYCRAAFEAGYAVLGFSAHAPLGRKTGLESGWHLPDAALDAYYQAVREAARRWQGKLAVFLGLEVDYIRGLAGPADGDFQNGRFDFLIGSVHYVRAGDELLGVDDSPEVFERVLAAFGGNIWALIDEYYTLVEQMLERGGFDILGHIDLIKKNNSGGRYFSEADSRYRERIRRTADAAGKAREWVVVEVNTGGIIRGKTTQPYPSPQFLSLLRERGMRCTINADAHTPESLARNHYGAARQALLDAGYTGVQVFTGQRPEKWHEEVLNY